MKRNELMAHNTTAASLHMSLMATRIAEMSRTIEKLTSQLSGLTDVAAKCDDALLSQPIVRTGSCPPKWTAYISVYGKHGVFMDVDTSVAGFKPGDDVTYTATLNGSADLWTVVGSTSLYPLPPTSSFRVGFRVYLFDTVCSSGIHGRSADWTLKWVGVQAAKTTA